MTLEFCNDGGQLTYIEIPSIELIDETIKLLNEGKKNIERVREAEIASQRESE